jgi:hypothetical protein
MNILSINLERFPIKRPDLLDFLTAETTNKGKQTERYWIVNTDSHITSQQQEREIDNLNHFLHIARANNFNSIMIIK